MYAFPVSDSSNLAFSKLSTDSLMRLHGLSRKHVLDAALTHRMAPEMRQVILNGETCYRNYYTREQAILIVEHSFKDLAVN